MIGGGRLQQIPNVAWAAARLRNKKMASEEEKRWQG